MKNRSLYLDEGCGSSFLFFLISQFCVYFCLRKHRKNRKKSYEIALKLLRFTLFNLKSFARFRNFAYICNRKNLMRV